MPGRLLVFDMDGVLVDVADSYRETIVQTVKFFTGRAVTREEIQGYKNRGGWNDDWRLSQRLCADLGVEVDYDTVVDRFVRIFAGDARDGAGLIRNERWIARPGLLERLSESFDLGIYSGRRHWEIDLTLNRFAPGIRFDPRIAAEDVENLKPAPDGLLLAASSRPDRTLWYVGDTVDDARCARAAGVTFIGIASPASPRHEETRARLFEEGAAAVLDDINQLEEVLAAK
jgi:HAD superfamily phosphatase